jgi:hypothetical protein
MAREDTDLPFGDAFGPAQLDVGKDEEELEVVLKLAEKNECEPDSFDEAIAARFFSDSPEPLVRAKNVRLGLNDDSGYGIVDSNFEFTEIGETLNDLRDDPNEMYDRFAQHILNNLHGMKVIEIIEDLRAEGRQTTNSNVKQALRDQYDFHIDRTSNHWSQMRAWLSKADIVNTGTHVYDIDRTRIEELVGVRTEEIVELDQFSEEQQAFLRALALVDPDGPIKNSAIRKIAEDAYDVTISQSNISRKTLDPLQEAGYIEWTSRQGKPNIVEPTDEFESEVLLPILEDLSERVGVPRSVLRMSFEDLFEQLDSSSTHEKGVALETLVIKLGRLLGLDFVGWRVRGRATGGSEVDVVMDDIGTLYNRVQIQSKNIKSQLETKHVAREVGISRMLQTNTILMVTRSGISGDAEQFSNQIMRQENIAIIFLEMDNLLEFDERPDKLLTAMRASSRYVHGIKRLEHRDGGSEDGSDMEPEEVVDEYEEELEKYQSENPVALGVLGRRLVVALYRREVAKVALLVLRPLLDLLHREESELRGLDVLLFPLEGKPVPS